MNEQQRDTQCGGGGQGAGLARRSSETEEGAGHRPDFQCILTCAHSHWAGASLRSGLYLAFHCRVPHSQQGPAESPLSVSVVSNGAVGQEDCSDCSVRPQLPGWSYQREQWRLPLEEAFA